MQDIGIYKIYNYLDIRLLCACFNDHWCIPTVYPRSITLGINCGISVMLRRRLINHVGYN